MLRLYLYKGGAMAYNKETGMYEGFLYIIRNDIKPELVYVGQTTQTLIQRWAGHIYQVKKHSNTDRLHKAMSKYGIEHFGMDCLEKCIMPTKKDLIKKLDEREKYYIELFDCYHNGFNLTKGGRDGKEHQMRAVKQYSIDGNYIDTYESVDKLKEQFENVSVIYSCCSGESKYAYGHIWRYIENELNDFPLPNTNEQKEALVRYYSLLPIDKYDYRGNLLTSYKSVEEASKEENIPKKEIVKCCTGKKIYINMNIFRFHHENFNTYKTYRDKPKLVEQYDYEGNFITVYDGVRNAARILNVNYQPIVGVCNGTEKTAYGFIWKYVENKLSVPDMDYNSHCKKVYKYDRDCNLICIYNSTIEASENEDVTISTICSSCIGEHKTIYSNFTYSHHPLSDEEIRKRFISKNCKPINMYSKDNKLLKTFDSCREAGKFIGKIHAEQMISSCCLGRKKSAYGYIWKYNKVS
jgi:group I intron endonuclease